MNNRDLRNWIRNKKKDSFKRINYINDFKWLCHRSIYYNRQKFIYKKLIKENYGKGLAGCISGQEYVIGVKIKGSLLKGLKAESDPYLLIKQNGKSIFGNYYYVPAVSLITKRIRKEDIFDITLTILLLEKMQHAKINFGISYYYISGNIRANKYYISNKLRKSVIKEFNKLNKYYIQAKNLGDNTIYSSIPIINKEIIPKKKELNQYDLINIDGIGERRKELLINNGISNSLLLSKINPDKYETVFNDIGIINKELIYSIVRQAKVNDSCIPLRINKNKSIKHINNYNKILILDIESDPDERLDFLYGFLELEKDSNSSWDMANYKYEPIFNLNKKNPQNLWTNIRKKLNSKNKFLIIHFGETESSSIKGLARANNLKEEEINNIQSRLIDIHSHIRETWILPVKNYTLKSIAKFSGFDWSQKNVDGAKALLWWRVVQTAKIERIKERNIIKIKKYNKDDCLGTWEITKWLLNNE